MRHERTDPTAVPDTAAGQLRCDCHNRLPRGHPRSPGALLVLTAETALGTVGGGQAEHDIIGPAMEMLRGGAPVQQGWHQCLSAQELRHMGQEFGGEEEILLLRWEPGDLPLAEAAWTAAGQKTGTAPCG